MSRLVLVHSGLCDNRMWDGFAPLLTEHEVARHEMRGWGDTPLPESGSFSHTGDLEAALEGPSVLVGSSFGGLVCLDLAAQRPELVERLVLMAPPLFDHEFSQETEDYGAEEERLLDAGDVDGVIELNVGFWIGGASDEVKDAVREMQRRSFELKRASEVEPEMPPDEIDLGSIDARTLVVAGEHDVRDFRAIAKRLAAELPNASMATVPGAYHLPALERPQETARLVVDFLEA